LKKNLLFVVNLHDLEDIRCGRLSVGVMIVVVVMVVGGERHLVDHIECVTVYDRTVNAIHRLSVVIKLALGLLLL